VERDIGFIIGKETDCSGDIFQTVKQVP